MGRLRERAWAPKDHSDAGALVTQLYLPALACALRYGRTTGYFTVSALTLAQEIADDLQAALAQIQDILGDLSRRAAR